MDTGVCCWLNKVNLKIYVGSAAQSLRAREVNHRSELRRRKSPCTEETRSKLLAAGLGREHSDETKAKIVSSMLGKLKGRVLTEEHGQKISVSQTGEKHTEESRLAISTEGLFA